MTTATKIRRARHAAGLTQEELARRVGVGVRNVPGWESGQSVPRAKTLRRIAEATGVELADLVGDEDASEAARSRAVDPFVGALRALVHSAVSEEISRALHHERALPQHDRRRTQAPNHEQRRSSDRSAARA